MSCLITREYLVRQTAVMGLIKCFLEWQFWNKNNNEYDTNNYKKKFFWLSKCTNRVCKMWDNKLTSILASDNKRQFTNLFVIISGNRNICIIPGLNCKQLIVIKKQNHPENTLKILRQYTENTSIIPRKLNGQRANLTTTKIIEIFNWFVFV